MKTMGLSRLVLVAPLRFPHPEADALAAGAQDVLAAAEIFPTLADAIANCRLVIATTARQRSVPMPELTARVAASQLYEASTRGGVALVFGRERSGLENEELQHCHAAVTLPANPDYSSLNVAAAVQIMSYELRLAQLAAEAPGMLAPATIDPELEPASQGEMEGFFSHLGIFLDVIDFHKGHSPEIVHQRLRRLVLRAQATPRELRILRGILSDAQRLLRLSAPR